jgi:hypothetical protein
LEASSRERASRTCEFPSRRLKPLRAPLRRSAIRSARGDARIPIELSHQAMSASSSLEASHLDDCGMATFGLLQRRDASDDTSRSARPVT